jgi:NAD(P)-dependent dehydrogenase (short-subunit alcohol dehydrogenase family)
VEKLNKLPGIRGCAVGIPANVAVTEEIEELVEKIKTSEGKLDILVANAAATWGSRFEDTPDHSNIKILDLNVRGVFNLAKLSVSLNANASSQTMRTNK